MTWLPRRFASTRAAEPPDPRDGPPPPKPDVPGILLDFAKAIAICVACVLIGFYIGGGFSDRY